MEVEEVAEDLAWAKEQLPEMLKAAGLSMRGSYRSCEVARILGLHDDTVHILMGRYTPDPETGKPTEPWTLDSFLAGKHRRVPHGELLLYLARNRSCRRARSGE